MERRKFIKYAGAGAAAGLFMLPRAFVEEFRGTDELEYHRITAIRFTTVKLNYPRQVGKNSQLDIHGFGPESGIHVLYTDQGASGWGLNRGSEKMLGEKFELIKGKSLQSLLTLLPDFILPISKDLTFRFMILPVRSLKNLFTGCWEKEDLLPFPATAG